MHFRKFPEFPQLLRRKDLNSGRAITTRAIFFQLASVSTVFSECLSRHEQKKRQTAYNFFHLFLLYQNDLYISGIIDWNSSANCKHTCQANEL